MSHRISALDAVIEHCVEFIDKNGLQSENYLKQDNEIHRYIPIGTIACVESYFRAVIKELIDFGSPFSDNALKLREIKFDFSVVRAIEGKEVTVGDFLSHLLPMKSFEDINSTVGTLAEKDFLNELKVYFFPKKDCDETENSFYKLSELTNEMNKEIAEIYSDVRETFKLRNIFCHEAAEAYTVDTSKIYKGYENTKRFLEASNEFIWDLVEPNRPMGTYGWQLKLSLELDELNNEIANIVLEIEQTSEETKNDFSPIQNAWEDYRNKRVEIISKQWEGGTGQTSAELSMAIYLTKARIAELKEEIKNDQYSLCPY